MRKNSTYSCAKIVSGSSIPKTLILRGNFVLRRISAMSAFRRNSSPLLWPEVKCEHTKQKFVWWRDMLTEMDPYNTCTMP